MSEIENEVKKIYDHSAVEEWELFEQENPEDARLIIENAKELGFRKVIHVKADGTKAEAYIPERKTPDEIEQARQKRERYYNRPTVEDYVQNARDNGDSRDDTEIVKEYVDTYYRI